MIATQTAVVARIERSELVSAMDLLVRRGSCCPSPVPSSTPFLLYFEPLFRRLPQHNTISIAAAAMPGACLYVLLFCPQRHHLARPLSKHTQKLLPRLETTVSVTSLMACKEPGRLRFASLRMKYYAEHNLLDVLYTTLCFHDFALRADHLFVIL